MVRILFYICLLIFNFSSLTAQDFWYEGVITLKNNLSLTGDISFNKELSNITYKSSLYEKSFNINELSAFSFNDYDLGIERYFITSTTENETELLEVLVEGRLPVYRKAKDHVTAIFSNSLTEEDYEFYIRKENELVHIKDFENAILPKITWEFPFEIRDFVYTYNLKLKITGHIVLIMQHYNALTSPEIDHSRVQKLLSTR